MPGVVGPSTGGRCALDFLDQAVVAAAAADAALRSERVGGELEHGPRVVVEAAHERRIDLVGDLRDIEQLAHLREVLGVVVVEVVEQPRRARHHAPGALVIGVERAQRVQLDPAAHLLGEARLVRAQVRLQQLAVGGPALAAAEA